MQTQNTMTSALVSAGFPAMSLIKRVWLWLHDHPGKTCREISVAIGRLPGDVSVALLDLHRRKMVVRKKAKHIVSNGARMTIFEYTTCIREYELLPLPAKKTESPTPTSSSASATGETERAIRAAIDAAKHHALTKEAEQKPHQDHSQPDTIKWREPSYLPHPIRVKDLSLGEALRLYGELKAVFGDRA